MTKAYRSAESGEYVTAEYAAEHPDTTVAEEVADTEVAAADVVSADTGALDLWQRVIQQPGVRDSGLDRCLVAFAAAVRHDERDKLTDQLDYFADEIQDFYPTGTWDQKQAARHALHKAVRDLSPPP